MIYVKQSHVSKHVTLFVYFHPSSSAFVINRCSRKAHNHKETMRKNKIDKQCLGLKSFNNEVFVQKTIETNKNHCKSPSYISFLMCSASATIIRSIVARFTFFLSLACLCLYVYIFRFESVRILIVFLFLFLYSFSASSAHRSRAIVWKNLVHARVQSKQKKQNNVFLHKVYRASHGHEEQFFPSFIFS